MTKPRPRTLVQGRMDGNPAALQRKWEDRMEKDPERVSDAYTNIYNKCVDSMYVLEHSKDKTLRKSAGRMFRHFYPTLDALHKIGFHVYTGYDIIQRLDTFYHRMVCRGR